MCVCVRVCERATYGARICYVNDPLDRITVDNHHSGHLNPAFDGHCSQCEPGIDFDEVHRHIVCVFIPRGHHEREDNFVIEAFDVVASAYLPKLATVGGQSVAAAIVAASGMVGTVKTANERKRYCQQIQNDQALVD